MTKKPKSTGRQLSWFDDHLIELIAGFLLAFIPLYPKWPLLDILPGYIVRIRLEDFVIAFAFSLFLIQVKRGKASLKKNPLFIPILIYLGIGFLSSLSAIFITHTVPLAPDHVGKLFLHWARRIEYMSLALIFFSAVTSRASIKRVLIIFSTTVLLVSLYGFGQKYMSWPVYSTMNREFAKGWRLVLTQHARVSSTFAGHYDLGAYTIFGLTLLAALTILLPKKFKLLTAAAFILTFAILLLTASRSSFLAYIAALTILCYLLYRYIGLKKAFTSWLVLMIVSAVGIRSFGDLYERFAHVLMLDRLEIYLTDTLDKFKPQVDRQLEITTDLSYVYTETDTPPSTPSASAAPPPDVFESIPLSFPEATLSAIPETSGTGKEGQPRTYSDAAFKYGLSSAIRFDVLWPRALAGLKTNPLLGSGYSTLTKSQVTDFTEAESTDNDFLRSLGETGLLGFLSFYGIFVYILYRSYQTLIKLKDPILIAFLASFIAGLIGLLINALYIDIFVSSKIAYTTWAFMGLSAGLITYLNKKTTP